MLSEEQVSELEYEVVPPGLKTKLTRLLRQSVQKKSEDLDTPSIYWQNEVINRANTITERPVYVLKSDDLNDVVPEELVWHKGEFDVCIRRFNSVEFIEFLAEMVASRWIDLALANSLLLEANISISFKWSDSSKHFLSVDVRPITDLNADLEEDKRPNIRTLVARLDRELEARDYAAVLHCSATIFETLAKDVVGIPEVADQTLGSFFDRYRKDSSLPEAILDYILAVYKRRNTEPLAGHGHVDEPTVTRSEAEVLTAFTKVFITLENRLFQAES